MSSRTSRELQDLKLHYYYWWFCFFANKAILQFAQCNNSDLSWVKDEKQQSKVSLTPRLPAWHTVTLLGLLDGACAQVSHFGVFHLLLVQLVLCPQQQL